LAVFCTAFSSLDWPAANGGPFFMVFYSQGDLDHRAGAAAGSMNGSDETKWRARETIIAPRRNATEMLSA
jgi:hypothetical protein